MDVFYTLTAYTLVALVAGFAAVLLTTILVNMIAGRRYRTLLAQKLDSLRLARMLEALGVDVYRYLHEQKAADIRQHMTRCMQCEKTGACDEHLASGEVTTDNIDYCNNETSLKDIVLDEMVAGRSRH